MQALLALVGLAASLCVSLALSPYSSAAAKHIYLQHLVVHGASETASTYHLSTTDAVTPALALQGLPDVSWRPSQPQAWQVCFGVVAVCGWSWECCSGLGCAHFVCVCSCSRLRRCLVQRHLVMLFAVCERLIRRYSLTVWSLSLQAACELPRPCNSGRPLLKRCWSQHA